MEQTILADAIKQATAGVFEMMLDLSVESLEFYIENNTPSTSNGVMALVGLAGPWTGSGCISRSADTARHIASQFLSQECESVDDEVLDAVGEVANMIIGNVKNDVESHVGPLGLSIPTVVFGRNFAARSTSGTDWVVVPFCLKSEMFHVKLCLSKRVPKSVCRSEAGAFIDGGMKAPSSV